MSESTDVWFTQDALDADNLPATRAVAEYCERLQTEGQTVRLFLDVSTAHRDLSLPRLHAAKYEPGEPYGAGKKEQPAGTTDNGGVALEEMDGTWSGFMGNRYYVGEDGRSAATLVEVDGNPDNKMAAYPLNVPLAIRVDSLKCNEYDAMVLHSVAKTYFTGTIVVIGGNLSHQQLWDKIVPNNFLMTKVEGIMVVGRSLQEFNDLQEEKDGQDPADYVLVNASANGVNKKQWRYTPQHGQEDKRRVEMRKYIDEQVAKYKEENDYATVTVQTALEALDTCGPQCLEVVICAPMDNVKLVLEEHATKVRNVVGEFGSLRVSDNVVGAQWNEFLDSEKPLHSAHRAFAAMRAAEYPVFFTPTQMFKNGGFPSVEAVFQKIANAAKGAAKDAAKDSDGSNLLLSYQECWNDAKRGTQAIFDPLCVIAKCHGLFATRANILASSSIFGGDGDGSGDRTFSCPAYKVLSCPNGTVEEEASTATTIEEGKHIEFVAQDVEFVTKEYLRLYDVTDDVTDDVTEVPDLVVSTEASLDDTAFHTGVPAEGVIIGSGEFTRGLVLRLQEAQSPGMPTLAGRFKLMANHGHAGALVSEHMRGLVSEPVVQNMRAALMNHKSKSFETLRAALLRELGVAHNAELLNTHVFHPSQWTHLQ
tara:strand:- start:437 stop:2380 length:1944 start_codon:yes stop_codon:yes gene_type:complete